MNTQKKQRASPNWRTLELFPVPISAKTMEVFGKLLTCPTVRRSRVRFVSMARMRDQVQNDVVHSSSWRKIRRNDFWCARPGFAMRVHWSRGGERMSCAGGRERHTTYPYYPRGGGRTACRHVVDVVGWICCQYSFIFVCVCVCVFGISYFVYWGKGIVCGERIVRIVYTGAREHWIRRGGSNTRS